MDGRKHSWTFMSHVSDDGWVEVFLANYGHSWSRIAIKLGQSNFYWWIWFNFWSVVVCWHSSTDRPPGRRTTWNYNKSQEEQGERGRRRSSLIDLDRLGFPIQNKVSPHDSCYDELMDQLFFFFFFFNRIVRKLGHCGHFPIVQLITLHCILRLSKRLPKKQKTKKMTISGWRKKSFIHFNWSPFRVRPLQCWGWGESAL